MARGLLAPGHYSLIVVGTFSNSVRSRTAAGGQESPTISWVNRQAAGAPIPVDYP